jgi:hypothetical protein
MFQLDFMRYATHGLIGYAGIYAYDTFVDDKGSAFSMRDAGTFAVSTVVTSLAHEVITGLLPYLNEGSLPGMVFTPVLNGVVYMYLYDYMVADVYQGNRENTTAFLIGSVASLLIKYVENPIASLFGVRNF